MPEKEGRVLDARTVRAWCATALDALGRAREEIDSINVYPVADGDTGTNLYLTMEAASRAVEAVFQAHEATVRGADGPEAPSLGETARGMAHGALVGARGNSGTILAQLLRGMAQVLAEPVEGACGVEGRTDAAEGRTDAAEGRTGGVGDAPHPEEDDERSVTHRAGSFASEAGGSHARHPRRDTCHVADGERLSKALRLAAQAAYEAVAHPVEGTVLTVATAAAEACAGAGRDCAAVARAAYEGAREALEATPAQLAVLGRAGVVDAGGRGLLTVLGALVEALGGEALSGSAPLRPARWQARRPASADAGVDAAASDTEGADGSGSGTGTGPRSGTGPRPGSGSAECACEDDRGGWDGTGPGYEVIYLLEAEDAAVARLRTRLDSLGDSLVVGGGDGLWNVHVHVDDAGAAVEAGIEAGRPHRVRITHFAAEALSPGTGAGAGPVPGGEPAARAVVAVAPGEGLAELFASAGATTVPARPGELPGSGELAAAIRRAHAREVVLLPNDAALLHTAAAAAEEARSRGVRVSVVPTRSPVQGIAALAVHERERRFDEDAVAMTSAAGAARYAEITVAEHRSWTSAGICQAGDVLGLIDGDVAVIGQDVAATARTVLDRMLAAGGEMVTLVLGEPPRHSRVRDGGEDAEVDVVAGVGGRAYGAASATDMGSAGHAGEPSGSAAGRTQEALARELEEHVRVHHLAVDTVVYHGGKYAALMLIGVE